MRKKHNVLMGLYKNTFKTNIKDSISYELNQFQLLKICRFKITLYRGTTGSEGKGGPLFMTDDPDYAATYIKNGGEVIKATIPRSTYNQMIYNEDISTFNGLHEGAHGNEFKIHSKIAPELLKLFKKY